MNMKKLYEIFFTNGNSEGIICSDLMEAILESKRLAQVYDTQVNNIKFRSTWREPITRNDRRIKTIDERR